jgi:hypothetical protein
LEIASAALDLVKTIASRREHLSSPQILGSCNRPRESLGIHLDAPLVGLVKWPFAERSVECAFLHAVARE